MKQAMNRMITAMLAIALVFSALAMVLPGSVEAAGSSSGDGKVMFNVIGADGMYINGASWTLFPFGDEEVLASGTTSLSGLGIAEGIPLSGNLNLKVSYDGEVKSSTVHFDSANREFEFKVMVMSHDSTKKGIFGYLSAQVPDTRVSLIDIGGNYETLPVTVKGNSFQIADSELNDAPYTLVVRAPGYEPVMVNITYGSPSSVTIDDVLSTGDPISPAGLAMVVDLEARTSKNLERQGVTFSDFDSFDWYKESDLSFDVPFPDYVIPFRMHLDTDFDGKVSQGEVDAFVTLLEGKSRMNFTGNFLKVDGIVYGCEGDFKVTVDIGDDDSVFCTDGYTISFSDSYVSDEAIDDELESHSAQLTVRYDSADLDRQYVISLPAGFEVDSQVSSSKYVKIVSADYNLFTVDPAVSTGSDKVGLTFREYGTPTASAAIDASDKAYGHFVNGVLKHYIVGKGKEVTFNASASADANGNPLASYSWEFGDGRTDTVTDPTVKHTYATASAVGYTVNLTVTNNFGTESTKVSFKVLVDGVNPDAVMTVVTANPSAGSSVSFSGVNSSDGVAASGDGLGKIAKWIWNFGDGSADVVKTSDNGNVSKTYANEGDYIVTLKVVDVAGNEADASPQTLTVLPSAKPSLSIQSVEYSPETFEEGQTGTLSVNVKNSGDAASQGFTVTLYRVSSDGNEQLTSKRYAIAIAPGENVTVELEHVFGSQGEYRLKVSVQDDDLRAIASSDFSTLVVNEAGWKSIAIFVGVIAVIGVIVALVYYRNRLPGRDSFKKGGPREPAAPPAKESPAAPAEEPRKKASPGGKSRKR